MAAWTENAPVYEKRFKQALPGRTRGDRRPAEPHVEEQPHAERRGHVDAEATGAVADDQLDGSLLAAHARRRLRWRRAAERAQPSLLVDSARGQRRFDRAVELVAPPERARRQPLDDHEVAVAIDRHAGQPFVLAREDAQRLGERAGVEPPAKLDRPREPFCDRPLAGTDLLVLIAAQHPDGDGVVAVDVAAPDELPVSGDEVDDRPGLLGDAARPQSLTVDPRMTCVHPGRDVGGDPILPHTHPHAWAYLRRALRRAVRLPHGAALIETTASPVKGFSVGLNADFRSKPGNAAGKDSFGMTSKPPYEMAASGQSDSADTDLEDLSDQITVDPSQDVTVEASEEATLEVAEEESAYPLTPPPMSSETPPPSRRAPTLMGLPLPSLPLPGMSAAAPPPSTDDDITVLARPSVTDDEEEETKVEPAETALHAAASKDDDEVTTALSAQASVERERALRKSLPPSLDLPLPHSYGGASDSEFEDPEDSDGVGLAHDTPGISVDDDVISTSGYSASEDEPSSELEAVLAPRRPTAALGSLGGSLGSLGSPFGLAGARALRRLRRRAPPDAEPRLRRPLAAEPGTGPRAVQLPVLGAPRAGGLALRCARPVDGIRADAGAADPGPLRRRGNHRRHQLRLLPKRADAGRSSGRFRGRRLHLRNGVRREVLRRPRGGHRGGDAAGPHGRTGRHSTDHAAARPDRTDGRGSSDGSHAAARRRCRPDTHTAAARGWRAGRRGSGACRRQARAEAGRQARPPTCRGGAQDDDRVARRHAGTEAGPRRAEGEAGQGQGQGLGRSVRRVAPSTSRPRVRRGPHEHTAC